MRRKHRVRPAPISRFLARAVAAKAFGITIYTIGLGADVNPAMLARIAGATDRVYLAPEAADLARIYAQIARLIPCR